MISNFKVFLKNLFKRKSPKIRFYSMEPGVVPLFPLIPSAQYKRKYLSHPDPLESLNVSSCPGIKKLTSVGWLVNAPADFIIDTNDNELSFKWRETWKFPTGSTHPEISKYINYHDAEQTIPLLDDEEKSIPAIVKVETPWRIEASDDVVFLILPVNYNNEKRFTAASGILDPKYSYNINVQLFWHVFKGEELVRAGTPLCQIIPIYRKYLSISSYDVTIEAADEKDVEKERAWIYASNCVMLNRDKLSSRLDRSMKILNKYRK